MSVGDLTFSLFSAEKQELMMSTKRYFFGISSLMLLAHFLSQTPLTAAVPYDSSEPNTPASSVDLRPLFKAWELGPLHQGNRGTCSVFVVVGALEYATARKQGVGQRLSAEYLNWATNQVVGETVDGGFFADLWKGFSVYGICPEPEMPYQDTFDPAQMPSEEVKKHAERFLDNELRNHWIKPWDPNTGLTDTQLAAIKQVIGRRWPVCGGFRWPKHPVWKDEVLEMTSPENVFDGHSLLLVGYRDDPEQPGGGVFIFRNSNNDHPEGQMTYQYASTYMNDAMWIDCQTENKGVSSKN